MASRAIRMMVSGAAGGTWLAVGLAVLLLSSPHFAKAQLGPVDFNGFLEYQYRKSKGPGPMEASSQLGTFRTDASTYLWRPWIMQVNASLGLTKTIADNAVVKQTGTLVTGGLRVDLLRESRFPFYAYADSRDSRTDGGFSDVDVLTRTYGFMQQYSAKRGGRYSLEYRRNTVDDLFLDTSVTPRSFVSDAWQTTANKTLGRNQFVFNSELTDISRDEPEQFQSRSYNTLRHRFRSGSEFFLEDTTFFSSERFEAGDFDSRRRFLQFNGVSTWRPKIEKPLLIVGRGLLQGADTGSNGFEQGSTSMALTGSVTYQYSDRVDFSGNVGIAAADSDNTEETTSIFQRFRANYRSADIDLWNSQYRWLGSAEVGNRTGRQNGSGDNAVQDIILRFNHYLAKQYRLNSGRQLEFNISQQLAGAADTEQSDSHSVTHTVYSTLSRQLGQTRSYIRMSATDRRGYGDTGKTFQLVNLQASRSTQASRYRRWSGSLTLQYARTTQRGSGLEASDNKTISYSANLSYRHANLFDVPSLNFSSELRALSSDFVTDDPFDERLDPDRSRTDADWRNRLDYRVGLLQLRLEANLRKIDSVWTSMIFLSIRRYYGNR